MTPPSASAAPAPATHGTARRPRVARYRPTPGHPAPVACHSASRRSVHMARSRSSHPAWARCRSTTRATRNADVTLIAIVGATGTGKSDFALDLAEAFGRVGRVAEVVNADAMQLYRGMDIGTATLPSGSRRGVPHHLLDVLDVTEEASAAGYQPAARAAIDGILARDGVALLVGGRGP